MLPRIDTWNFEHECSNARLADDYIMHIKRTRCPQALLSDAIPSDNLLGNCPFVPFREVIKLTSNEAASSVQMADI